MITIDNSDFGFSSLEAFPLGYRWTNSRWNKLPDAALKSIQPLTESKAREICQYTLNFLTQEGLDESQFDCISEINTSIYSPDIGQQLRALSSDLTQQIILSWDAKIAVITNWGVFCEYWDDFCYPASDDVAVFPFSEKWMLAYSHSDYFTFGAKRNANHR